MSAREAWRRLEVRWFFRDSTGARRFVRDLVGKATSKLDLIDPYFGDRDLMRFALATTIRKLPVRILTASAFCVSKDENRLTENGALLLAALSSVRTQDPNITIAVKVMGGKKSPIHDRILIVDDEVWTVGSSLNEVGDRGTLIVRLPTPPPKDRPDSIDVSIYEDVFEPAWSGALCAVESLEDFVARRSRERRTRSVRERARMTIDLGRRLYEELTEIWSA